MSVSEKLNEYYEFSQQPFEIDVVRYVTYGVLPEHNRISLTNQKYNEQNCYNFPTNTKDHQFIVGYRICNVSEQSIKDIVVPVYEFNEETNRYEGREELIDLKKDEKLVLPTRYLIFLLMSHGQSLQIHNGRFEKNNIDDPCIDQLSNFHFVPEFEWSDYFSENYSYEYMGAYKVSSEGIYLGFDIIPEPIEYRQRFGFLVNSIEEPEIKEQLVNDIKYEDISDSIKFLAALLWKKELK